MVKQINLLILTIFIHSVAQAGTPNESLSAAKDTSDRAANEYFKRLRKLGSKATEAQKQQALKETLLPAQAGLSAKYSETQANQEKEIRKSIFDSFKKHFQEAILDSSVLNPWGSKKFDSGSHSPPPPVSTSETTGRPNRREEFVLDSKDMPESLTFPGKKPQTKSK